MSGPGEPVFRWRTDERPCPYRPDQVQSLEYVLAPRMTAGDYRALMDRGWRRFGAAAFRPSCPTCRSCRSLRVDVGRFRPDRSQRRVRARNEKDLTLEVAPAAYSDEVLDLFDRYHAFQERHKGWPAHDPGDVASYRDSFLSNPFPTFEHRYRDADGQLVAVGFVDRLPQADSAIYCTYDPELRDRSLGTWNVLCVLDEARRRGVPWVHLGYFVDECPSLRYKARFAPNQVRGPDGAWRDHSP